LGLEILITSRDLGDRTLLYFLCNFFLGNNSLKLHKNFEYPSGIGEVARQNLGTGSHRLYQTTSQRGRSGGSYVTFLEKQLSEVT
jgi:hypothetical protein